MSNQTFLTGLPAIMMNIRYYLYHNMRKIHGMEHGGCRDCFCRIWEPVSVDVFISCYAQRIAAGMEINIAEKLEECSTFVGHCTCICNCKELS